MGKKNKKGGKATLDLNSFLNAGPTAPSAPSGPPGGGYGGGRDDRGGYGGGRDRDDRGGYGGGGGGPKVFDKASLPSGPRASMGPEDIDLTMLPSSPPYTVFLGNLAYETQERDIEEFFAANSVKVTSVRIPRSIENDRIKGFGYAEFDTVEDLKAAIGLSNENILNRRVRIDLAGQGQGGDRDRDGPGGPGTKFEESRADNDDMWRRPAADKGFGSGPGEGGGGGSFGGDRGGFGDRGGRGGGFGDRDGGRGGGFDRGGGRGGGFDRDGPVERGQGLPDRQPDRGGGFDRGGDRGGGYDRPPPRVSRADEDSQWTRGAAPPPREERPGGYGYGGDRDGPRGGGGGFDRDGPRGGGGGFDRGGGDRYGGRGGGSSDRGGGGGGGSWERGAAPPPREDRGPPRGGPGGGGFDRGGPPRGAHAEPESWSRGEALPARAEPAAPAAPAAPPSRPKLNLARRSAPADAVGQSAGGSDLFGAAKPVDTAAKLAEVEAKLGEGRKYAAPKQPKKEGEEPAPKPVKKASAADSGNWERGAAQGNVAPKAAAPPASKEEAPAAKAPVNAFAGLAVEDDGDDN